MGTAILAQGLSKLYTLGSIGTGNFYTDLSSFWAKVRGKADPHTAMGETPRYGRKGNFWALRDVSFELEQGQRLGVLGRNGAGKSTLLKILSRITAPTEGRCFVKGRAASLLEVGTGFHPDLTGRENVFLNGAILGMRKAEVSAKFDEIVAFSEIEDFIDTPVKRYSSGMYVRLAFAVAAHLDAEILIADEVLAVGDMKFMQKSLGKMHDISEKGGKTVIFVSHSPMAVKAVCNSGIVLEHCRIVYRGNTIDDVMERYDQILGLSVAPPEQAPASSTA